MIDIDDSDAIKRNSTNRGKKRIQRIWNSAIFTLVGDRQHTVLDINISPRID